MARKGGARRGKVSKFTKTLRQKGKVSITRYLSEFSEGDKVALTVEPSIHSGMYYPRYIGKTGIVLAKKGTCYEVKIRDMNKYKTLIVHPVHMKKVQ